MSNYLQRKPGSSRSKLMNTASWIVVFACTATVAGFVTVPAFAEEKPEASSSDPIREEIVVTARRREERLLDVPISLKAFTSDDLAASGVARLRDLGEMVPNLVATGPSTNGRPDIVVRGIQGSQGQPGADLSLATYVNGVYMGRDTSANPELFDIERVEVLRGPQGTLYGKNSISGAVNIVTTKPGNEFSGKISADFGNYNLRKVNASVDVPIAEDKFAMKVSAFNIDRDGYNKNSFNGTRPDEENSRGVLLHLRSTPTDNLEINLTFDGVWENRDILFSEVVSPASPGYVPGLRTVNFNADQYEDREVKGIGLAVDYELQGGYTLTSVTGLRKSSNLVPGDTDDGPLDLGVSVFEDWADQFSQEFRIASPSGGTVDYVAGLFYFRGTNNSKRDIFAGNDFLPYEIFGEQFVRDTAEITSTSYAVFANANWHLTEKFTVVLGGRLTKETKSISQAQMGAPLLTAILGTPNLALEDQIDETNFSPLAGLSYAFSDDLNVYAQASRGFRSGSFSTDLVPTVDNLKAKSEYITNYEVGAKGSFLNQTLNINAALFYMQYTDIQVGQRPAGAVFSIFTNAGKATSVGGELEIQAFPIEGLELSGGIGYADATFDTFKDCFGPGVDCDGNRLPRSPELTANAAVEYSHPIGDDISLVVRAEYFHRGKMYFNSLNDPAFSVPSINVLNGRIGITRGNFDVFIWGKNLNGELVLNGRTTNFFGDLTETYGPPRTYGVSVAFRF